MTHIPPAARSRRPTTGPDRPLHGLTRRQREATVPGTGTRTAGAASAEYGATKQRAEGGQ